MDYERASEDVAVVATYKYNSQVIHDAWMITTCQRMGWALGRSAEEEVFTIKTEKPTV